MEIYKELITVYRTTNRLDKVKEAIDSSMVIAKKYDMQSKMLIPLMELALYYSYDTADYEKGITYCEQFLEKVEQLRDADVDDKMLKYRMRTESVIVKIELAKCYIKTGKKIHLVLPLLDEARAFFGQYGDQEKLTRIYAEYLDYYIKKGDSKMMLAYLDKYIYHDKLSKQQIMDRSNEVTKYVSSLLKHKEKIRSIYLGKQKNSPSKGG